MSASASSFPASRLSSVTAGSHPDVPHTVIEMPSFDQAQLQASDAGNGVLRATPLHSSKGGDDRLPLLEQGGLQYSMLQQHGYVYLLSVLIVHYYYASREGLKTASLSSRVQYSHLRVSSMYTGV